jgi:hypothetical protein
MRLNAVASCPTSSFERTVARPEACHRASQLEHRLRNRGAHPAGHQEEARAQDHAGGDQAGLERSHRCQRFSGIDFGDDRPLHVRHLERCPRPQHRIAAPADPGLDLAGFGAGVDRRQVHRQVENRGPVAADPGDGGGCYAARLEVGEEGLRPFDLPAQVAARRAVRADHIRLSGVAEAFATPVLPAGHHPIDLADRELHGEDAAGGARQSDRRRDEGRRREGRRHVGRKVLDHGGRFDAFRLQAQGPAIHATELRRTVRFVVERHSQVHLLHHRVKDPSI